MGRHGEWRSTSFDTVAVQVTDACLTEVGLLQAY
jgi:hypothetical protein